MFRHHIPGRVARTAVLGTVPTIAVACGVMLTLAACSARDDLAGPQVGPANRTAMPPLSHLDRLRQIGEGCAVAASDSQNAYHAVAVPSGELPFSLPRIKRGAPGSRGAGKIMRMVAHRRAGTPVVLTCWVPDTLTEQQLASAVHASLARPQWTALLNRVDRAPELPEPSRRPPVSAEALTFANEMLDSA